MGKEHYLLNLAQYGELQFGQNLGEMSPLNTQICEQRRHLSFRDSPKSIICPTLSKLTSPQSIPLIFALPMLSGNRLKCVWMLFNPCLGDSFSVTNSILIIIFLRLIIILMTVTQILTCSTNPRYARMCTTSGATGVFSSRSTGIGFKLMPVDVFGEAEITRCVDRQREDAFTVSVRESPFASRVIDNATRHTYLPSAFFAPPRISIRHCHFTSLLHLILIYYHAYIVLSIGWRKLFYGR